MTPLYASLEKKVVSEGRVSSTPGPGEIPRLRPVLICDGSDAGADIS